MYLSRFEKRKRNAYHAVRCFWNTYGALLQSENRHGTFKYDIVEKMGQLYQDIEASKDESIIRGKILDILREQRTHIIQFESCIDTFNDYLCALRLLDVMFRYNLF
jgi:hypothetical protein